MNESEIMEILLDCNFWKKKMDTGIRREGQLAKIRRLSTLGEIVVVSGVRRSGKSTILLQFCESLLRGGTRKEDILIINFEDPRFKGLGLELLNRIYEFYQTEMNPKKEHYVVLDEVQVVDGWEKFARYLHESKKVRVFVTGSSSKLMSSEYSTVLAGRHVDAEVYPLSFREFLAFRGIHAEEKIDMVSKRHEIKRLMTEYLKWGGFPKPALLQKEQDKQDLLNAYFMDILVKDIAKRYKIKDIARLEDISRYYLSNISSLQSFNKLKAAFGVSLDTVERFSRYFSDAHIVFFVKKFSFSEKEQILNPKKVYCIDTGMRNAVSFVFMENIGRLMENAVFLELKRRKNEVYYWKGKTEVDFVAKDGLKSKQLIQVCYDLGSENTKKREVSALMEAMAELNQKEGLVITWDYEDEERMSGKKIIYKPIWKWLLEES